MADIFSFLCAHAQDAHYLFFGMLLLAGVNVPLSEDLILLMAGALASLCLPNEVMHLYAWVFLGCFISGSEAYWIGRVFGKKLYGTPLFRKIITPQKIENLKSKYERFGIWTFIVGRFIPCGFRNALFITSGMGKMSYRVFVMRDGIASLISSACLFTAGFQGAAHHEALFSFFKQFHILFLLLIGLIILYFIFSKAINKRASNETAS